METDSLQTETEMEVAILAGGGFWGLEAVYQMVKGVLSIEPGYTGGVIPNPTYNEICSGETGHLEAVKISFDPKKISYRQILEIFFIIHDPTQRERQGRDIGSQYRSAIFWLNEYQRFHCTRILEELRRIKVFLAPIVTEIQQAEPFYPAENYHRNYYKKNQASTYCKQVIYPKLEKFKTTFPHLDAEA